MKHYVENVLWWVKDHPILTIWLIAALQGLIIDLTGGA
jgi:hypothetical protein